VCPVSVANHTDSRQIIPHGSLPLWLVAWYSAGDDFLEKDCVLYQTFGGDIWMLKVLDTPWLAEYIGH
jgi:hypothetical protein